MTGRNTMQYNHELTPHPATPPAPPDDAFGLTLAGPSRRVPPTAAGDLYGTGFHVVKAMFSI
jgi:hypothetical protein